MKKKAKGKIAPKKVPPKKKPAPKRKKPAPPSPVMAQNGMDAPPAFPSPLEVLKMGPPGAQPTPELTTAICYLIRSGATAHTAMRAMGIPRFVAQRWIQQGIAELEDPRSPLAKFVRAVDTAEAQDEVSDLQLITLGAKHWAALAWKRERKTPQRWGPKSQPTGDTEIPLPVEAPSYQMEDAAKVLAILEKCGIGLAPAPEDPVPTNGAAAAYSSPQKE